MLNDAGVRKKKAGLSACVCVSACVVVVLRAGTLASRSRCEGWFSLAPLPNHSCLFRVPDPEINGRVQQI